MPGEFRTDGKHVYKDLVIPAGEELTTLPAGLGGFDLCGIKLPSNWTTAALSFCMGTFANDTYSEVYTANDSTTLYELPGAIASGYYAIAPGQFAGVEFVKVRSGTASLPVSQVQEVTIRLCARFI